MLLAAMNENGDTDRRSRMVRSCFLTRGSHIDNSRRRSSAAESIRNRPIPHTEGQNGCRWARWTQASRSGERCTTTAWRSLSTSAYSAHALKKQANGDQKSAAREFTLSSPSAGEPALFQHMWRNDQKPWIGIEAEWDHDGSAIGAIHRVPCGRQ